MINEALIQVYSEEIERLQKQLSRAEKVESPLEKLKILTGYDLQSRMVRSN